ncbi:DUF3300 domain-containing protein [[Pseudomonas] boreopolis]|uniref:DUF3300 domain-containing protein n=1 Tax=Xanthomonas boreopolis TaxID=86183 RepID=UPI003D9BB564
MDTRTLSPARLALAVATTLSVLALGACQQPAPPPAATSDAAPAAPAQPPYVPPTAEQLYKLVAPIALFPDKLVAQTLAASVYPDQVLAAQGWLHQNGNLSTADRLQGAASQPWDPSVKALSAFPDVVDQLAGNLDWTRALGDAYAHDPNDVLDAIQVMRQRAQASGHLRSTPQQRVQVVQRTVVAPARDEGEIPPPPRTIVIEPTQPDVVYVPRYDPGVVYGTPVDVYSDYRYRPTRVYDDGDMLATGLVSFGVGVLVGSALEHHHHGPLAWIEPEPAWHGWGWNNWGVDWNAPSAAPHYVVYQNRVYAPRTTIINNRIDNRIDARSYDIHQDNRSWVTTTAPPPAQAATAAGMPMAASAAAQRPFQGSRGPSPQVAAAQNRGAPDYAHLSTPHFNAQMLQPGRPVAMAAPAPAAIRAGAIPPTAIAPHDLRAQPAAFAPPLHPSGRVPAPAPRATAPWAAAAMQAPRHGLPAAAAHARDMDPMRMPMPRAPVAVRNAAQAPMPARQAPPAFAPPHEVPRAMPRQEMAFGQPHPQRQQAPMPSSRPSFPRPPQAQRMAAFAPPHAPAGRAPEPRPAHPQPRHDPHHDHDKRNG